MIGFSHVCPLETRWALSVMNWHVKKDISLCSVVGHLIDCCVCVQNTAAPVNGNVGLWQRDS